MTSKTSYYLKRITVEEAKKISLASDPVPPEVLIKAKDIVENVRRGGDKVLLEYGVKFGDLEKSSPHIIHREQLKQAYDSLPPQQQAALQRTAKRIQNFAQAQRDSLSTLSTQIPGGKAGHDVSPVHCAGCYAPGGRYPLPSSVLMTVVTARVAGVKKVWVASPKPEPITLAAAFVANADALLAIGGAQAIAAFAYGTETIPKCDAVVGPGNVWVTAAKQLIAGRVALDTLAGPSECLVIADDSANPATVAADLLAQAEHDTEARAILIALSQEVADRVDEEVGKQLETLTTADVARKAIEKSFAVVVPDLDVAGEISDSFGPEHLELHVKETSELRKKVDHFGGLFIGHSSAEVLGDYGIGPNHVLPTRGAARSSGGLSVFTFLRIRTWMEIDDVNDAQQAIADAVVLARLEGLEGHARAAEKRLVEKKDASKKTK